jgi:CheY-like chemotaxis protein
LGSVTILIADDEPYIVRSLSYILQREGISFAIATDGQEALQMVRQHRPKIFFLDIMMPKKQVLARVKKLLASPTTGS